MFHVCRLYGCIPSCSLGSPSLRVLCVRLACRGGAELNRRRYPARPAVLPPTCSRPRRSAGSYCRAVGPGKQRATQESATSHEAVPLRATRPWDDDVSVCRTALVAHPVRDVGREQAPLVAAAVLQRNLGEALSDGAASVEGGAHLHEALHLLLAPLALVHRLARDGVPGVTTRPEPSLEGTPVARRTGRSRRSGSCAAWSVQTPWRSRPSGSGAQTRRRPVTPRPSAQRSR